MKPETRARLSAKLKAFWTSERRKAHGARIRQSMEETRLSRLMDKRRWEADANGWEIADWPRQPADQPPTLTSAIREWLLTQYMGRAELERWRERRNHVEDGK